MHKIFFSFFSVLLLSSCFLKPDPAATLKGTWRLYDVEPQLEKSGGLSFSEQANLKQMVKEGKVLSLFDDGSYTELTGDGGFTSGQYRFEGENRLQLMTNGKEAAPLNVKLEHNKNGKQLLSLLATQQNLVFRFAKESEPGKNFGEAPFYAGNNQWRIKPSAPENNEQQMARLTNYVKHVALILKAAKEGKQEIVSFEFSQGPIKIYNGGIGIHPYEIVPDSWKKTFYSEADALSAYRLYERYLQSGSYKGGGTGDWVEDDYNILLSIYAGLTKAGGTNGSR